MSNHEEVLATLIIDRSNALYKERMQIKYSTKYKNITEKVDTAYEQRIPRKQNKTHYYLIREIQIKNTLRHHFSLFRLTKNRGLIAYGEWL